MIPMRRLLILATTITMMTMPAWAVGTVNQSLAQIPGSTNYVFTENWTADATTGSVPATVMAGTGQVQGFRIVSVEIAPGSPAPTNNYTVTITDFSGADVLGGAGANQSSTVAGILPSLANTPPLYGAFTVNVTGNVVNSAQGRILVYFAPVSQVIGNTPTGSSLTATNLFTGANTFSGTTTLSGPNVITGTDSGNQTITGNKTFTGVNSLTGANTFSPAATSSIASSPTGATESGTTVTITTTAVCAFTTGQWVTIAGVTNASYNGIVQVLTPGCNGGSSFTFTAGISGFAASGSGSVAPATIFNSGNEFGLMRGNITPTTAAGPTGANNENFLFVSGNCNPTTEYNFIHAQNTTEALTGCIEAPVGGFAPVYNGIAGYATNNLNASANGVYAEARCRTNNSACWGTDTASRAESGLTGVTLTGAEYEMYPKNTTDFVNGAKVGGDFPIQPTSATAFEVLIPNFLGGTGQWTNGLTVDSGSTTGTAVNIGLTAASGNSLGSQTIQFNSKDAGGVVRQPTINSDLSGNIFLNVTSGGQAVVINGPASSLNTHNIINPSGTPLAVPTTGNNVVSSVAALTFDALYGTYRVTTDQTITAGASLTNIPGLSWTFPANTALNVKFTCDLLYSQATAAASDSFGFQDVTVAPTNAESYARADTSATAFTAGNSAAAGVTTAVTVVTYTPSAATTVFGAHIDGLIEQPSNASTSAFNIMAQFTTNNGTIKRGSSCQVF